MKRILQTPGRAWNLPARRMAGLAFLFLYVMTIPFGNWIVMNVGLVCPRAGDPCLVPVLPGMWAPSGVLVAGLALVLRDAVQSYLGAKAAFVSILLGEALSGLLSPVSLVVASAVAFLFSETADLVVYTPLRRRSAPLAVLLSGVAGAMADSALFLSLAFGSLEFFWGQVVGKLWMSVFAAGALFLLRQRSGRIPAATSVSI